MNTISSSIVNWNPKYQTGVDHPWFKGIHLCQNFLHISKHTMYMLDRYISIQHAGATVHLKKAFDSFPVIHILHLMQCQSTNDLGCLKLDFITTSLLHQLWTRAGSTGTQPCKRRCCAGYIEIYLLPICIHKIFQDITQHMLLIRWRKFSPLLILFSSTKEYIPIVASWTMKIGSSKLAILNSMEFGLLTSIVQL